MIYYGVTPMMSNRAEESDAIVGDALVQLRDSHLLNVGDTVVVAFGRSIKEDNERIRKREYILAERGRPRPEASGRHLWLGWS